MSGKTLQRISFEAEVEKAMLNTRVPIFVTLRYKKGSSDKFYCLYISGATGDGSVNYGRWPKSSLPTKNSGQVILKTRTEMLNLYWQKITKGYEVFGFNYLNQALTGCRSIGLNFGRGLKEAFRISRRNPLGQFLEEKGAIYDRQDNLLAYVPLAEIKTLSQTWKFPCELIET